ncbi:MAG: response regulator [Opitutaceae bacterium]|nr:response regulator [Opitutaceae bacterium]
MATAPGTLWQRWLAPDRRWSGERALVPVETCRRTLDLFLWLSLFLGSFGLTMAYVQGGGALEANPLFWMLAALQALLLPAALFRGWPLPLRFAILWADLFLFPVTVAAVIGISANWAFQVTMLVMATNLLYGARAGLLTIAALGVAHVLVAWGWVTGRLPAFMSGPVAAQAYSDYARAMVWVRVLVIAAGLQTGLVFVMRYVLRDLNHALRESNRSLQSLAVEQEHRARAEEARLLAERSAREVQKFDALGRLASGVAHDINNALCVVKCWNSVLSAESRDPLVREAMAEIAVATENASQLTQHLLAFSRHDSAKVETLDLAEVVRREARTLGRLLPRDIAVTMDAAGPAYVRFGRGQLQAMILNLAINARDAMPGGGALRLRVARGPSSGQVTLEVEDTGAGMDEAVQARIFEPFFTTKASGKGTGLGLAMVYGLVTGVGGSIKVRSAPGQGSCFSIALPESAPPPGIAAPSPAAPSPAAARCRVLVADDNQEIRTLVGRILQRDGFGVVLAENGNVAADLLAPDAGIGLLIVDGIMPGKPTQELIRLAEAQPGGCRVIVASGYKQSELVRRGIETGRYVLLPKPFELAQLRQAVGAALG